MVNLEALAEEAVQKSLQILFDICGGYLAGRFAGTFGGTTFYKALHRKRRLHISNAPAGGHYQQLLLQIIHI